MIGTRLVYVAGALMVVLVLLLGVGLCYKSEALKRATHDVVADSLARDTQDATAALAGVDTVYREGERVYLRSRARVDTVRLPPEARDAIRACDSLVLSCRIRAERSDSLAAALRRELEHALDPPPGKRLSFFGEAGYDLLDKGAIVGLGAAVRLVGPVSLMGKVEGASQVSAWREPQTRAVVGLRFTFR